MPLPIEPSIPWGQSDLAENPTEAEVAAIVCYQCEAGWGEKVLCRDAIAIVVAWERMSWTVALVDREMPCRKGARTY